MFVCLVVSKELKDRLSIGDGVMVLKGKISLLLLLNFNQEYFLNMEKSILKGNVPLDSPINRCQSIEMDVS